MLKVACLLASGKDISWMFEPIVGEKNWQISVSALQGIVAKEQVISSMEIISGITGEFKSPYEIFNTNGAFDFFNKKSAIAYVIFLMYSVPCIATISSLYLELKDKKLFLFAIIYQLVIGWLLAVTTYKILNIFL